MSTLTRAHQELFRRPADERFASLPELAAYCNEQKRQSRDLWKPPKDLILDDRLSLCAGTDGAFALNDWSFSQLCRLSGVAKDTINRLSATTAALAFGDTMPRGSKPLQLLVMDDRLRSIHGTQYTRLWDADLVHLLCEFAVDFQPPQTAVNGGTGLYAGEQDLFCFLIDPAGWCEIEGEAFAPGFFVWNSEVGKRSLGLQTFWFQSICQNHIVWDATEIVEWTRKHTARVQDGLSDIRRIIEGLVTKRDARRDGFYRTIKRAMEVNLGDDAEKVLAVVTKQGVTRQAATRALQIAQQQGRFTIWSMVDALTRIAGESAYAGERLEADIKAAGLLQLAA